MEEYPKIVAILYGLQEYHNYIFHFDIEDEQVYFRETFKTKDVDRYIEWYDANTAAELNNEEAIPPPKIRHLTYDLSADDYDMIDCTVMEYYIKKIKETKMSCYTISNNFAIKIQRLWRGYFIRKSIKLLVLDLKHKISLLTKSLK